MSQTTSLEWNKQGETLLLLNHNPDAAKNETTEWKWCGNMQTKQYEVKLIPEKTIYLL